MLNKDRLKESIRLNIEWFENSGVMDPADGSWGVGERVVLTEGNEALESTYKSFPAYAEYNGYAVIEHRRPDCNFETALMFLLAAEILDCRKYYETAENILFYLFRRSGMRNTKYAYPDGVWKWSSEQWSNEIYFDDNAWNAVISIIISKKYPELEKKFDLLASGLQVAEAMESGFEKQFKKELKEGDFRWAGSLDSPHWGSMACMTFACAFKETGNEKYKKAIQKYDKYILENRDSFSASEHAYIVIGSSVAAILLGCEKSKETALTFADILLSKQEQSTGNIPSEWGKEAPTGEHLVDTVYTQNWAALGLRLLLSVTDDEKYKTAFEKAMGLLLDIQDDSPEKYLKGCWRGMYDLDANAWGGGDRFEGGANSIYTGWTNAPISIVAALEFLGLSRIF